MILIESVKARFVDGPITTIIHDDGGGDFGPASLPVGCTYTTETVVAEHYTDITGRRFEIGMTEEVRDILGLPLQSFQAIHAELAALRAETRAWKRMPWRRRLKFLFSPGGGVW